MRRIFFLCLCLSIFAAPAAATTPWVHEDWQMRVPFNVDPALIEGDETFEDFALLVTLDNRHADVFGHAKPDGSDLLFASADGATILEREIVHYDQFGTEAEIWVRVPGLSKLENNFYVYFDNPLANLDPSPSTAWSSDYRAVFHFEDDPANLLLTDSSPVGGDVSLNSAYGWSSSDAEPVKIGRGWHLNGTTHHIRSRAITTRDSSFTFEAWLTHDDRSTDFFLQTLHPEGWWHISSQRTSGNTDVVVGGVATQFTPVPLPLGEPAHHYVWKFDAVDDTMFFYLDGVPQEIHLTYPAGASPLYTGRTVNPNGDPVGIVGPLYYIEEDFHSGQVDEYRVREGRPSSARILTEFRTANDPVSFLNFGGTESIGLTGLATATRLWLRSYPNPSPGSTLVRYALPAEGQVRIMIYDAIGRKVASIVDQTMPAGSWTAHWDGRSTDGQRVAAGVYFLSLETSSGIRSRKLTVVR